MKMFCCLPSTSRAQRMSANNASVEPFHVHGGSHLYPPSAWLRDVTMMLFLRGIRGMLSVIEFGLLSVRRAKAALTPR